jgi:GTPase SAR1 family protein
MSSNKRLVTVGDAHIGKSSLLHRLTYDSMPPSHSSSTVGAAFFSKDLSGMRLNMWDTAGQERFRSIIPLYLRDADVVLLVYDLSDAKSFEHLKNYWIDFAKQFASENPKAYKSSLPLRIGASNEESRSNDDPLFILIGNKSDLKNERQVSPEEGVALAKDIGSPFIELSALHGYNVNELLNIITEYLATLDDADTVYDDTDKIVLATEGWVSVNNIKGAIVNSVPNCSC